MPTIGSHCILEMYDCPSHILDDQNAILAAIREAAKAAHATLLQEIAHRFEPHGVTALALLAESHVSVHTWPEFGYAAADVFTCGEETLPERACEVLARELRSGNFELRKFPRGADAPQHRPRRLPAVVA